MDHDRVLKKQLKRLDKQENRVLNRKENTYLKSKTDPVMEKIQGKIPEKLKTTLEAAFFKGFKLVFEKGHKYIEKTYKKDKLQFDYDLNNHRIDRNINNKKLSNKHIRKIDKQAKQSKLMNTGISVLEGGILGALGIGLPDIPLFISVMMKNIYEIALGYGYDYNESKEKYYILLLIGGALTKSEEQKGFNRQIDRLGMNIDKNIYAEIDIEEQMRVTSSILSEAMLTTKFIQGIPIVGAVGGVTNFNIIKKVGRYAGIKYKKRYLLKKAR